MVSSRPAAMLRFIAGPSDDSTVPDFHGRAPLAAHPPTIDWLRRRADARSG